MKFTTQKLSTIVIALALASVVGCAATPTRESTGEYVDDSVITTRVKKAIFDEPYKGIVQLSGFVSSAENESKATEVARNVKGVTSVKDDMRLK